MEVKGHCIDNGLVEWLSIVRKVISLLFFLSEWHYSGSQVALDWQ